MGSFIDTYYKRKNEIEEFLELMEFLEKKEQQRDNEKSEFARFFYPDVEGDVERIHMSYQSLINISKSNLSLMIYNLIEFTVTSLIDSIYDEIRRDKLSYIDVNEHIQDIWKNNILKSANDPSASFNTFIKKNEEIITAIIEKSVLDMDSRSSLSGGNLDWDAIQKTLTSHEIPIETGDGAFRPDILLSIKENRNNLAHGAVSFVDALRDDSINDMKENADFVMEFLETLISTVTDYIDNEKYKYQDAKENSLQE